MADVTRTYTFFTSAARTASVAGTAFDLSACREMVAVLSVTAKGGTSPTCDVKWQASMDKTIWADFKTAKAFTQATDVSTEALCLTNFGGWVRPYFTIGGTNTPTFTFTVVGTGKSTGS